MLDLEPGVHLHEPECIAPEASRAVDDELDRTGADITDGLGGFDRRFSHGGSDLGGHAGRGRLLDHLLMPALQRAIALEQVHGTAVAIAEHLDLDVPRRGYVLLDQDLAVAERRLRFPDCRLQRGFEFDGFLDAPHAPAAAARHRLDQHRIADLLGLLRKEFRLLALAVIAGHDRHAGVLHQLLGLALESHGADRARGWTDENDSGGSAGFGEFGVLRQEAVPGMNALGACAPGQFDQLVDG